MQLDNNIFDKKGLTLEMIEALSEFKKEPKWMRDIRIKAFKHYLERSVPTWGADLSDLIDNKIQFFKLPASIKKRSWEDVPTDLKNVYDELKIPESEKKFLAGVETQFDSNVIYGRLKDEWKQKGVIFTDSDSGLREYPELFKKWFGKVVPYNDNKYAALNTACWSGGSFVYIPKGVNVTIPLQAYFYIQTQNLGQFERTMIIADVGSNVQYVEGCTAPAYSDNILHSGVIELVALKGARIRYTTIQNWSKDVYNLVTQRGFAFADSKIEWVDCNLGSKVTMKYPSVYLNGEGAKGEVLSIAFAGKNQTLDTGAKMIHRAPNTSSIITTKSICQNGGRTSYRGLVQVNKGAKYCKTKVVCDALILDSVSQTDTYPINEIKEKTSRIEHEASVSKVSESQLHYLMSHGLTTEEASGLIISGFIEPIAKELPMEYAMEMNDLLRMSMKGSVG